MSASPSVNLNDTDVLHILLKLSSSQNFEWEPQYPFLDTRTVSQVSNSLTSILHKGTSDLKKQLVPLIRKWCTGKSKVLPHYHTAWIGRSLTVEECVDSILSVCISITNDEEDWNKRDTEQQLALCYAFLGAATNLSLKLYMEAGKTCDLLVRRMLKRKVLGPVHHRFLAQVWSSVGGLPIVDSTLIQMVERSPLGIEKTVLWLGVKAVSSNQQTIAESFDTIIGLKLLLVCCKSALAFQNVCNLLTYMMATSEAHPGIQALIKAFVSGVERQCNIEQIEICSLYEESCQVVSALLSVDPTLYPELGQKILSREIVLLMLRGLPREQAACLLSHRPSWLLYTF